MSTNLDYYTVLQVPRTASIDDIKKSYRKLAVKMHPDTNKDKKNAEEQFKQLSEAYGILSDPDKKAAYDRFGSADPRQQRHQPPPQSRYAGTPHFFNEEDFFGSVFGNFFQGGKGFAKKDPTGTPISIGIHISLKEAYTGCIKNVEYTHDAVCDLCRGTGSSRGERPSICRTCNGSGSSNMMDSSSHRIRVVQCRTCVGAGSVVEHPCRGCSGQGRRQVKSSRKLRIPPGLSDDNQLNISQQGNAGLRGAKAGDLHVTVKIMPHENFTRVNHNLTYILNIPYPTAVLGGKVTLNHLDDQQMSVNVPKGIQSGHKLLLRGKGMPIINTDNNFGDLLMEVKIDIPTNLTDKQKTALEQFQKTLEEND